MLAKRGQIWGRVTDVTEKYLSLNTGPQLAMQSVQLDADTLIVLLVTFMHEIATSTIIPNITVSLVGFQKFFLFWIAGTILKSWKAELDRAHSFMFQFCF